MVFFTRSIYSYPQASYFVLFYLLGVVLGFLFGFQGQTLTSSTTVPEQMR